jgi:hypothetical protein
MISRSGKDNFFKAHYDWIAAGAGALALVAAAAFYVSALGDDPEAMAGAEAARVERMKSAETGVKPLDMSVLDVAMRTTKTPPSVSEVSEKSASFLASERRVLCKKCKKAIPGNVKEYPVCECGEKQEEEKVVVLDADNDGMSDEWENKFGLNTQSAADASDDVDGDGFSNLEEFQAKTDPKDGASHPDYLDYVKINLPLKETYMPFIFRKANKIPSGWRCEFFAPNRRDDYGRRGATLTAVIGEAIADTGFVVKGYEAKSMRKAFKGGEGVMTRMVDISEVTLERKSDSKKVVLVVSDSPKAKPAPVDVQATLFYERDGRTFDVVAGAEITLNGCKYKVAEIKREGKGAKVTVAEIKTGKKRTLQALEP